MFSYQDPWLLSKYHTLLFQCTSSLDKFFFPLVYFRQEFAPTDDELAAYRKGEDYDPEKAKEAAKQKVMNF